MWRRSDRTTLASTANVRGRQSLWCACDAHRRCRWRDRLRRQDHARTGGVAFAMSEKPLLIGQLAKLAGVKPDTVRFYERSGLLPKPSRSASGYRVYDD